MSPLHRWTAVAKVESDGGTRLDNLKNAKKPNK